MRSKLYKSLALVVATFVMLGALAVPQASAQGEYPPVQPTPLNCVDVPAPTLTLDGFDTVTTFPEIYLQCVVRIVVEFNPVLYDGPPPASRLIREPLPPLSPGEHTITATATTVLGVDKIATLTLSADQVAAINALIAAAGGGIYQDPSGPGGLPIAGPGGLPIAVPVPGFAVTGSNVNLPIALGATLVGAGGIALMIARRREQEVLV